MADSWKLFAINKNKEADWLRDGCEPSVNQGYMLKQYPLFSNFKFRAFLQKHYDGHFFLIQ